MSQVYALLVGINEYPPSVRNLRGCIRDIEDAQQFLAQTAGSRAQVRTLINGQATRDAVVDGIRDHLGLAGTGDTALFWFSGHGSTMELPRNWWHLEPNGGRCTLSSARTVAGKASRATCSTSISTSCSGGSSHAVRTSSPCSIAATRAADPGRFHNRSVSAGLNQPAICRPRRPWARDR